MVKSATRMEATGLLTRRRDETDARLVRLYLAPQARAVRSAIEAERHALAARATAGLTAAEQRALIRALTKIVDEFAHDAPVVQDASDAL